MLWHLVRTSFPYLLDGGSGYDQFYMFPLLIASSIDCLHVQLTSPDISGVDIIMLQALAREYLSVYSVSLDGALISHLVGRVFTVTIS